MILIMIIHKLFQRTTYALIIIYHPLLKTGVLYTFLSNKNSGTYSSKKPLNLLKLGLYVIANKPTPHAYSTRTYPLPAPS